MSKKSNIKLTIAYDGMNYAGWQRLGRDSDKLSLQGLLESVLTNIMGEEIRIVGASRTDATVHAFGQVANFITNQVVDCTCLKDLINENLPRDIRILECEKVNLKFHSRYHATGKLYEYHIDIREVPDVFQRKYALSIGKTLDIESMRKAAKKLVGKKDFAGFSSKMIDSRTTVRTIYSVDVEETDQQMLIIRIYGDGFLYNMIRILVGTLIEIGEGTRSIDSIEENFIKKDRSLAGPTVSGHGLFLCHVYYGE